MIDWTEQPAQSTTKSRWRNTHKTPTNPLNQPNSNHPTTRWWTPSSTNQIPTNQPPNPLSLKKINDQTPQPHSDHEHRWWWTPSSTPARARTRPAWARPASCGGRRWTCPPSAASTRCVLSLGDSGATCVLSCLHVCVGGWVGVDGSASREVRSFFGRLIDGWVVRQFGHWLFGWTYVCVRGWVGRGGWAGCGHVSLPPRQPGECVRF